MKLLPDVKCRRCGQVFPSYRNTCPNCGTRRVRQSSRVPNGTPSTVEGTEAHARTESIMKWQMIFGGILVVAVILAVVVMVSTSLNGSSSTIVRSAPTPTPYTAPQPTPVVEAAPTPSPTPVPTIEKLNITYYGTAKEDITMHVGDDPLPLAAGWSPADIQGTVRWQSSDSSLVKINVDPNDGNKCTIECLGTGDGPVKITCTLFNVTSECVIRCLK